MPPAADVAPLPVCLTLAVLDASHDISLVWVALASCVVAAALLQPGYGSRDSRALVLRAPVANYWCIHFANAARDMANTKQACLAVPGVVLAQERPRHEHTGSPYHDPWCVVERFPAVIGLLLGGAELV